jgi:hypothetical protein
MLCVPPPIGFEKIIFNGQVIVEVPDQTHKYGLLLSSTEGDFETNFCKKQPGIKGVIVSEDPCSCSFKHIPKSIGGLCTRRITDLHDLIDSNENLFLKLDIKGYEFEWIRNLKINHLQGVDQLILVLYPANTDQSNCIKKISTTHNLVHCIISSNSKYICTYLNKRFFLG